MHGMAKCFKNYGKESNKKKNNRKAAAEVAYDNDYVVEEALNTLVAYDAIKKNKTLMKDVRALAKKKVQEAEEAAGKV